MSSQPTIELHPTTHPLSDEARREKMKTRDFGRVFTEHMVVIPYEEGHGWGNGALKPYGSIQLDPSASVFHYGQAIFEGYKAYHQPGGGVSTFRPRSNAERFNRSAERLAMPALPPERFIEAADVLIRQDRAWLPSGEGESLYLRPFMIATDCALGVRPSKTYLFFLIASPAAQYFPRGISPVTVQISETYVRASPGGTGAAKFAGNYAASLLAQKQALLDGCDQVVWLDAIHRKYVEEMGGMNIFFVLKAGGTTTLLTPQLTGTLLPGVTRDSILTLGQELGMKVEERSVSVDEWREAAESGAMAEAFACGTAAVVTPIGSVKSSQYSWQIGGGQTGPVAAQLRQLLLDIQHGKTADTHGWMHRVL